MSVPRTRDTIQQVNIRGTPMAVEAKRSPTQGAALSLERQSSAAAKNTGSEVRQPEFRSQLCRCGLLVALYLRVSHWYLSYRVIVGIKRIAT